ncbi:MAG: ATP-binding protein [Candidatus Thiodiazotropha taylori]|nr:ATP-binding protein [Candidatus Thiodiazotropha taylori]MCG8107905.1 ATP-binding protein [Candidatus Thiodiazotropha taylori]MCG8111320.1 ATP-binding protein [Candidatus Thiodiazotropha taylori]MCW4280243.1 ATP-binding protein [Candidatus Thiodiazotropha taylori]MCW4283674.1 ATP-binding protein [Candidatus Thiodiazotropha taylori]
MLIRLLQSTYYWIFPIIFWLALALVSLIWNLSVIDNSVEKIAFERGQIMYEMVRLTKINPVLMANDPTLFKKQNVKDIQYRAVSSKPMNPENISDAWESQALNQFAQGTNFKFEAFLNQQPAYFRYIGPVYMQEQCLQCHGYEGKVIGNVRGGISVKVLAEPIIAAQGEAKRNMTLLHFIGFLLIAVTSNFLMSQLRKHWLTLKLTQQDLKDKEQFLSDVTNSMSEGFVVLDNGGVVKYTNPESARLIGWTEDEMLGKQFSQIVYGEKKPPKEKTVKTIVIDTLKDGVIRADNDDLFTHKSGHQIDIVFSVSPMLQSEDEKRVVLTFSDISERKRADRERMDLERQLNQTHKMEAVGQLAGGIAHEINTPIQYIGDNLKFIKESQQDMQNLLQDYAELSSKAKQQPELHAELEKIDETIEEIDLEYLTEETTNAIDQSITGASQVARIVLAMKEFAHPGGKDMALADLNRIVSNAVAVCKNEWKYVADTQLQLSDNLPDVKCLAGEVSQVVLNIIVNAAHAIEAAKREEKGTITITTELKDEKVEIRVSDTGTGIPEEAQAYVFNPFFTTKDVGRGTGQGLAIAQDIIVGKHQGELLFETEQGVGTTFIIRLPLTSEMA